MEIHIHPFDIYLSAGITDSAQYAAPIGVCAEHGSFKQRRVGHRFGGGPRIGDAGGAGYPAFQKTGRAFAVCGKMTADMYA